MWHLPPHWGGCKRTPQGGHWSAGKLGATVGEPTEALHTRGFIGNLNVGYQNAFPCYQKPASRPAFTINRWRQPPECVQTDLLFQASSLSALPTQLRRRPFMGEMGCLSHRPTTVPPVRPSSVRRRGKGGGYSPGFAATQCPMSGLLTP